MAVISRPAAFVISAAFLRVAGVLEDFRVSRLIRGDLRSALKKKANGR